MNVGDLLDRFQSVTPTASGWLVRCPAHEDGKPSLSIREGEGGKILIRCFAGCSPEAIVEALGLKMSDLFADGSRPSNGTRPAPSRAAPSKPKRSEPGHIVAEYDYHDEGGALLFQVVRFDPKGFRQRTPDGQGGWLWKLGDVRRVPYRLSELLAEPGKLAVIVEGEKDVDRLRSLGFLATTSPQGAGNWNKLDPQSVARAFSGRDVAILADADEPGMKHAQEVARSLSGIARTVKLLEMRDLPDHGLGPKDISEWLDAGGNVGELQAAIDRSPEYRPAEPPKDQKPTEPLAALSAKPSDEDLDAALRNFAALTAKVDGVARQVARRGAMGILEARKIKGAARLVDAALGIVNAEAKADDGQGQALSIEDPEPWESPVDGAEVLDEIRDAANRHLVLPEGGAEALALWVGFAHGLGQGLFETSPRLVLSSPLKRCGKTRTLSFVSRLVARPLLASNVTPAALFRTIEKHNPSLLIDEADTALEGNEELRGIMNSGHTKDGAFVIRCDGEAKEPRIFRTWCPMAIALIGKLEGKWATLEDRAIVLEMRRKLPAERVEPLKPSLGAIRAIQRKAARWLRDALPALQDAEPEVPGELDDRAADNWTPLLAIADCAGGHWPETARRTARRLSQGRDEGEGALGVRLLEDIRGIFDERGADRLLTREILEDLNEMDEAPWAEACRGKPLNAHRLGRLLRPFGVSSETVRTATGRGKGYDRASFADAWGRYTSAAKRDKRDIVTSPVEIGPENEDLSRLRACHASSAGMPEVEEPWPEEPAFDGAGLEEGEV